MAVSRRASTWSVAFVVLLVMTPHLPFTQASSDAAADTCEPLCDTYMQANNRCMVSRNCFSYMTTNYPTFMRCAQPCWDISSPCINLCNKNYNELFGVCDGKCANDTDANCVFLCFDAAFADQRDRELEAPNPNIGAFRPL